MALGRDKSRAKIRAHWEVCSTYRAQLALAGPDEGLSLRVRSSQKVSVARKYEQGEVLIKAGRNPGHDLREQKPGNGSVRRPTPYHIQPGAWRASQALAN